MLIRLLLTAYVLSYTLRSITMDRPKVQQAALDLPLTSRELEVLCQLAEGLTNAQIASRLYISVNTVRAHIYSIYAKLHVSSRVRAARFAIQHALI